MFFFVSPRAVQVERLCLRSGLDDASAQQRIDAQMSLDEKCRRATIVIENVNSIADLEEKVKEIYDCLRKSRAHWKIRFVVGCVLTGTIVSTIYLTKVLFRYFTQF